MTSAIIQARTLAGDDKIIFCALDGHPDEIMPKLNAFYGTAECAGQLVGGGDLLVLGRKVSEQGPVFPMVQVDGVLENSIPLPSTGSPSDYDEPEFHYRFSSLGLWVVSHVGD